MKIFTKTTFALASYYNKIQLNSTNSFKFDQLTKNITKNKKNQNLDLTNLPFGQENTDHMVSIISKDGIWQKPQIKPFANLDIHPFNSTLHYAVQCYQGQKAYKNDKGQIRIFRPDCNMYRFKHSSTKIALPDFDGVELRKIIEQYVRVESSWIPPKSGYSLYLRPFHFSLENSLGVKSPHGSQILVVASPVGPYYPTGFKPISITCSLTHIRSAPRGTGGFKVGGNYGPTITVANEAAARGYQQVLYLFGDKIGQVGTSNIFFVLKDPQTGQKQIITPALEDLVLPGVTRDTIIQYLKYKGYKVTQRQINITQLIDRHSKGQFLQCFCSGTAVIVSPVKLIQYNGIKLPIQINQQYQSGQLTNIIFKDILAIQQGRIQDPFGWTKILKS